MAGTAGGNITVVYGNILSSDTHIAHCVSADLKMSRGVALQIRNQFGGLELLKSQNLGVGGVGITTKGHNLEGDPQFIFHLVRIKIQ